MTDSVSHAIVDALGDAENATLNDLDYTLEEYIDTDALAQLAAHESATWTLSFALPNHEVTVKSDGLILVDDHKKATWASTHSPDNHA